jgi:hypothetical protein
MRSLAAFLLGLVWFVIFGVYAIVTLPVLTLLMVMMVGAVIRGDDASDDKWRDRIDLLFYPTFWLAVLGIGWVRAPEFRSTINERRNMSAPTASGKKTKFRVTVDYGDDRIRTYAITASDMGVAVASGLAYAQGMLTVEAADDWDEDYSWAEEPDGEWEVE